MFQPLGKRDQGPCHHGGRDSVGRATRATFAVKESLTRLTLAERRIQAGLHTPVRRRRHRCETTQDLLGKSATTSEPLQAQLERALSDYARRESTETADIESPDAEVPRTPPQNMDVENLSNEDEALLREVASWRSGGEELEELKNAVASMRNLGHSSPLCPRLGLRQPSVSSCNRVMTWSGTPGSQCHDQRTTTGPRTPMRPGSAPAGGRLLHPFASPELCRTPSRAGMVESAAAVRR